MFDFGRVSAGWLEFDSDDLDGEIEMSISEYTEPAVLNAGAQHPHKTAVPVRYGNTYRLELNTELYEGVRYGVGFTSVAPPPGHDFRRPIGLPDQACQLRRQFPL